MDDQSDNQSELESLESPDQTVAEPSSGELSAPAPLPVAPTPEAAPKRSRRVKLRFRTLLKRFNIYVLFFLLLILVSVGFVFITIRHNHKASTVAPLTTQNLTSDTLKQLQNSQTTIGDPKQILNVESNAIFAGTVLIRQSLDIAGQLKVGGGLSLASLTVSGTTTLDQLQANGLVITGNTTVQKSLTVNGGGTFGGTLSAPSLNINTLQLAGDLQLNRHIDAGGATPTKADGNALGGGGTSSVSGSDTAGTVTINTGNGPAAGCFVTVTFAQKFNGTPHVVITPIGSAAASLNYYLNRSNTNFSICTANAAPAGASFSFDFIVVD